MYQPITMFGLYLGLVSNKQAAKKRKKTGEMWALIGYVMLLRDYCNNAIMINGFVQKIKALTFLETDAEIFKLYTV